MGITTPYADVPIAKSLLQAAVPTSRKVLEVPQTWVAAPNTSNWLTENAPLPTTLLKASTPLGRALKEEKIGDMVEKAIADFDFQHPKKLLPQLLEIHQAIAALSPSVWKDRKLAETKALIKACAGLALQLNAERAYGVAGETVSIKLAAVQQSDASIGSKTNQWENFRSRPFTEHSTQSQFKLFAERRLVFSLLVVEKESLGTFRVEDKELIGAPKTPPYKWK